MPHSLSAGPGQEDPAVPSSPPPAPAAADAAETKASLAALFDGSDDEGDDDGISDGDFGSSQDLLREAETSAAAAVAAAAAAAATARYTDPELLRAFYQRLFPFRTLFHWLNHGPKPGPDFANREFAFTLQNGSYLRYQSFTTGDLCVPRYSAIEYPSPAGAEPRGGEGEKGRVLTR